MHNDLAAQIAAVRLAYDLDPENPRDLTDAERASLASFRGWGQFAAAFAPTPAPEWLSVADELEGVLPADAFAAASEQVDTSFYTPKVVTDAVYSLLRSVGVAEFPQVRAFEPGCGAGAFMSAVPADMNVSWTGVDIDPTATRIARLLHPEAEIITGRLEATALRDGTFDIAVGNVPFSATSVGDNEGRHAALHNYFLQRAAAAVRPGGYVVAVTSRHTMDARNGLLQMGVSYPGMQFAGAVRLPSGAFADAGTDVVTDIVALRRFETGERGEFYAGTPEVAVEYSSSYYSTGRATDHGLIVTEPAQAAPGIPTRVSAYWADNLSHIAGTMQVTTFDRSPLRVASQDVESDIASAVATLAAALPKLSTRDGIDDLSDVPLADADGRKEGSFHVIDGAMHRVTGGMLTPVRNSKELAALVALRDRALDLLKLEEDMNLPDTDLDVPRAAAREAYEAYTAKFGPLNRGTLVEGKVDEESGLPSLSWRRPAMGGFRRDPDSALVMALEVYSQSTGQSRPADILTRRVNRRPEPIEHVDTPAEALAVSLGESGHVGLERIAGLLSLPSASEARTVLAGLVFDDPQAGLVPATEYLSGNVRAKLTAAEAAGLQENADALRAVLPEDLGPMEISLNLGHPLLTVKDITSFIEDGLDAGRATVLHEKHTGTWEVQASSWAVSTGAQLAWGTPDITPARLVELALNGRAPEVTDRVYDPERRDYRQVRNVEKTTAAAEKLEAIRDRFTVWVWEDKERSERLVRQYNDIYNSYVTRTFSGTGLVFPRKAANFTPWTHQRAAVERIVSTPTALIGHPVGAGKSAEMALAAVTLREFGLATKPLIVVPNHLLEQMAREAQQVIPTAKLLIATKEDLQKENRRVFAARCATGDWDAVIMTHSAFTLIPMHPDTEFEWMQEQKFQLKRALSSVAGSGTKGAKAIARRMRAFDSKMSKLRMNVGDKDAIYFDQLGVDFIMVDEAHLFRRLDTGSTQRGTGFGTGSSKRATDLLLKVDTLRAKRPGKPVAAFFTGTPWSNSLAETWVWQRYLQPEVLDDLDLRMFDAWVSVFVKYETAVEVAPDGSGFRSYRRPTGLVNFAELKTMLAQVADVLDPEKLETERPCTSHLTHAVPGTDAQLAYVSELAERADDLRSGHPRKRGTGEDNMLVIVGDGRKVALDPRLVGLDEDSAKVAAFADEAAAQYHRNATRHFGEHPMPGGFQLVFCDLGTPHPGQSQTYGRIRKALVDRGVPSHMIRFVHDATTDKARAALFAACRDGEVAFLLGSTPKVGMGTNVQTRLTDLWHLDAPWLPAEFIQRNGRGDRHGNLAGELNIHRVVAEGTFDAYIWQTLERKSRSFDALYSTGAGVREIEEVSAATLSYGELKAVASGNPLLLEQAEARATVKKLRLMRSVHLQGVSDAAHRAKESREAAKRSRHLAAAHLDAAEAYASAGAPPVDVDVLARVAKDWITYKRSYQRYTLGRLAVSLSTTGYGDKSVITGFDLEHEYTTLTHLPIAPKTLRRGPAGVAAFLAEYLPTTISTLEAKGGELIDRADDLDATAAELEALVEASVFDKEAELADAVARLARIDAAIEERASTDAAGVHRGDLVTA